METSKKHQSDLGMLRKGKNKGKDSLAKFFKAASQGDLRKLKALLDAGQKVEARDDAGKTALMRAAERGHVDAAKVLLAAGAKVSSVISNRNSIWFGCNALIFAAKSGNAELVEVLINAGGSPKCKAADATTPLSLAVEHGSVRMVQVLLDAGTPLPRDILVAGVWNNLAEITLLLVQFGANVNVCDDLGQSVLHRAAEKGQLETVRALIRAKAKLNQKANRCTPLLVAVQNGHAACALELIRAGADLFATDVFGKDALMNAAHLGDSAVVLALLKAGANTNARDKEGKTALMLANEKDHADIVRMLRETGSDEAGYHVQEYIRAAIKGDVKRVRQFLEAGMDVNATYQNGAKALICAILHGQTEVVGLLIEWGVDVSADAGARLGDIPLETDALALAADKGHLEIVRLLLKAGANVNRSRMVNRDVLAVAAREGHSEIVRELLKAGYSPKKCGALDALESAIWAKKEDAALILIEAGLKLGAKEGAGFLVTAAMQGLSRAVKALLDAGVDPKVRNEYDQTALQAAEAAGHSEIVALLRNAKSPQASPELELIEAAERGDLKVVHRLILEGVDLESRDGKGATALIRASANGHLSVMKELLSAGADPNASTGVVKRRKRKGFLHFPHMELTSHTPLSCAVAADCLPGVEMLLWAGADIRKTECGHLACMILQRGEEANLALVERLLDAGMDPNACWPVVNVSLLECAVQERFGHLVEKLIRNGARLNTPLARDRAILDAIESERVDIATMLIEVGIAPAVKGQITPEALVTAAALGLDEAVRLLLKQGVKIDRRIETSFESEGTVEGVTALMAAARHGRLSTVEILLSAGADPKIEDAVRRTALDWARDNQSKNVAQRICRLLEAAGAKK